MEAIFEFFRSLWVVWLGLIFLAIVAWALWPGNRKKFDHAANIPLRDDEPEQTQPPTQAKPKEPS